MRKKFTEHYRRGLRHPLRRDELVGKFNDGVQWILNPDQTQKLLESINSLENLNDIQTLITSAVIC